MKLKKTLSFNLLTLAIITLLSISFASADFSDQLVEYYEFGDSVTNTTHTRGFVNDTQAEFFGVIGNMFETTTGLLETGLKIINSTGTEELVKMGTGSSWCEIDKDISNPFTVNVWASNQTTDSRVFACSFDGSAGSGRGGWELGWNGSNNLFMQLCFPDAGCDLTFFDYTGEPEPSMITVKHFGTGSSSNVSVYMNNNFLGSFTPSLSTSNFGDNYFSLFNEFNDEPTIGTAQGYIQGWYDELGIWNRLLNDTEMSQLYNSGAGFNPFAAAPNTAPVSQGITTPANNSNLTTLQTAVINPSIDAENDTLSYNFTILYQSNSSLKENLQLNTDNTTVTDFNFTDLGSWILSVSTCDTEPLCDTQEHNFFIFCDENWVQNLSMCINNNQTIIYTDSNNCGTTDNLPVDNGTTQFCAGYTPVNGGTGQDLVAVIIDLLVGILVAIVAFVSIIGLGLALRGALRIARGDSDSLRGLFKMQ